MKKIILFFTLATLFSCNSRDNLIGRWQRIGDQLSGMQIDISKVNSIYSATIVRLADNDSLLPFAIGDIKWKNIRLTGENKYDYEDLQKYQEQFGSLFTNKYQDSYLTVSNDTIKTRVFSKGEEIVGTSQIWIRVKK